MVLKQRVLKKRRILKRGGQIHQAVFFIIYLKEAYPINVLNAIKHVPEVCRIIAATANPLQVIVAETDQGRGILGVVDGFKTKGVEEEKDIEERRGFLRKIGYKL
ncbi:hypothetical protein KEJ25_06830 [Candidatus Bathyarchaeota archaeon]|nr:hypothetical protein [Candidatus Bathyarchaeota archaeon]